MYYKYLLVDCFNGLDRDIKNMIKMYLNIRVFSAPTIEKLLTILPDKSFIDDDIKYHTTISLKFIQEDIKLVQSSFNVYHGHIININYHYISVFKEVRSVDVHINDSCAKYFYTYTNKPIYNANDMACKIVKVYDIKQALKRNGKYIIKGDVAFVYDPSLK